MSVAVQKKRISIVAGHANIRALQWTRPSEILRPTHLIQVDAERKTETGAGELMEKQPAMGRDN